MPTYPPLIVGVFQNEADAKNALDALRQAGFKQEQIGLAARAGETAPSHLRNDLVQLGVPQDQASYYDNEYQAGHPILSVRADGRDQEAATILRNYSAYDYQSQSDNNTFDAPAQNATSVIDTAEHDLEHGNREQRTIPVREEVLNAEKERVQTGEVRLHKEVVEEQRTITVPVTHEEVVIERRAVEGGRLSETPIDQDETIRIPVSEEQVNVTKTPVQTGEVSVGKRAVQENREITDTIRREEPRIEQDGKPIIHSNDDTLNP